MSNRLEENASRFEKEPNRGLWINKKYTWNSKLNGRVNSILDKAEGRISELDETFEELIQSEAQRDQEMKTTEWLKGIEDNVRISNMEFWKKKERECKCRQ